MYIHEYHECVSQNITHNEYENECDKRGSFISFSVTLSALRKERDKILLFLCMNYLNPV